MSVKSVCGVILASRNPRELAEFYATALGITFEREEHDGLLEHFGADIGEVHFGIHPPENLGQPSAGNSATSIAFNVESLREIISRLDELGAVEVLAPHDEGFGMVATYADPEGNHFEIVELDYEFGAYMIKRISHGWTTHENAETYERLLTEEIFPEIEAKGIPGYMNIELLRRDHEEEAEFVTIMSFESWESIKALVGDDLTQSYIPAKARAVLSRYDEHSQHYKVRVNRNR